MKHSRGKNITVSLNQVKDNVVLMVEDDGVGIHNGTEDANGTGLRNMVFRAHAIGASIDVQASHKGGTLVTCVKPLNAQN